MKKKESTLISKILQDERVKYLIVGGINTVFGYLCSLIVYYLLKEILHTLVIAIIFNIICITFSFVTYKLFVFKTVGNWIKEYLRCYIVYGSAALVSSVLLWILVDFVDIPFWIAQILCIAIVTVFSYLGHKFFTFNVHNKVGSNETTNS